MLRRVLALLTLTLVVFGASAQDAACSILTYSRGVDVDSVTLYAPGDSGYAASGFLTIPASAQLFLSNTSTEKVRFTLVTWDEDRERAIDLYSVTPSAIVHERRVTSENRQPIVEVEWSSSGQYVALLQYFGSFQEQLRVYAIDGLYNDEFYWPTPLTKVAGVRWAPGADALAFIAHDIGLLDSDGIRPALYFGVYAVEPDGTPLYVRPIVKDTVFARYQWLSGTQLAVTECPDGMCQTLLADIATGEVTRVTLGPYVPEGYVAWRQDYLVTRIADRAVGLWNEAEGFQLLTGSARVTSRPTLTSDGRHLSVRLEAEGQAKLLILDLFDSKLRRILDLRDLPELFADNSPLSSPGGIPTFNQFGEWNVREQKFLYTDGGAVHVYDTVANETRVVIEQAASAQWVCPSRG